MNTFCKLIELPETQFLALIEYDDAADETHVRQIFLMGDMRAESRLIFTGESQEEDARKALEKLDSEQASRLVSSMQSDFG